MHAICHEFLKVPKNLYREANYDALVTLRTRNRVAADASHNCVGVHRDAPVTMANSDTEYTYIRLIMHSD